MFCKLYFFWNKGDWADVLEHLGDIPEPYQIVTDKADLCEYLQENGRNCKTLRMLFPEEAQVTYEVYRNSKQMEKEYQYHLRSLTFDGVEIYSGIEPVIMNQFIRFCMGKKMLESNVNTIFIFNTFWFTYFAIVQQAIRMGYDAELEIFQLEGSKVTVMKPESSQLAMGYRKRLHDLFAIYFPSLSLRRNMSIRSRRPRRKVSLSALPTHRLKLPSLRDLNIHRQKRPRDYKSAVHNKWFKITKKDGVVTFDYRSFSESNRAIREDAVENFRFAGRVFRGIGMIIGGLARGMGGFAAEVTRASGSIMADTFRPGGEFIAESARGVGRIAVGMGRVTKVVFSFIGRTLTFKTLTVMNMETTKRIFDKVEKKVQNTEISYNAHTAFFFTTNSEDIYLKSLYPVMDFLKKDQVPFQVFIIDLTTQIVLANRNILNVNFFEEVEALTMEIKKSEDGRKTRNRLIQIARENNLSLLFLGQTSEYLLTEVYRTFAIMAIVEYISKSLKLNSVVVASDGQSLSNCVSLVAKKLGIPSIFVPSTIINANPLHAGMYHADKVCMYGMQGYDTFMKLGYEHNRVVLTGNPKYDYLNSLDPNETKRILEKTQGVASSKKLIVIGMARWHEGDEEWMSQLIRFCNKMDYEIAIKIHPTYKTVWRDESERRIQGIMDNCKDMKFLITYDVDLYTLLASADLVITEYSNVGAEAVLLEKPLLTVNFIKESFENEQRYHETGAAIYFEEYPALENTIFEMFEHGKHLDELQKGRRKMIDMYNYYNDGKASERICGLITEPHMDNEVLVKR